MAADTRAFLEETLSWRKDRSSPVHFAGRASEMAAILSTVANAQPGAAGLTLVVQGAPGSGKTALLREAARRFEAAGNGNRAIYIGDPWPAAANRQTLERIASAAFGIPPGEFRNTETSSRGARMSASVVQASNMRSQTTSPAMLNSWLDFENAFAPRVADCARTLVLVDESQNFEDGTLLRALHTQHTFPFLLVCGGLSNVRDRLMELGISRLSNNAVMHLGSLEGSDAREVALRTLRWTVEQGTVPPIRHTHRQVADWADAIAEASMGWPQHLSSYLTGMWQALAESESVELSSRNMEAALRNGGLLCAAYYADRITAAKVDPRIALAVHQALAGSGLDAYDRAFEAIEAAVAGLPRSARLAHDHNHPSGTVECLARLLKSGVVETKRDGFSMGSPIPSMTEYLRRVSRAIAGDGSGQHGTG